MGKTKKALIKDAKEINNIEEGKEVVLFFNSGQEYTGIFKGLDDDQILLKSLNSEHTIGLPKDRLTGFLERIA